jgi:GNAT superfamily N-acetyltransferase
VSTIDFTRESVVLPSGETVELHAMAGSDAAALLEFHHGLSAETTYLRFFNVHPELSVRELEHFTHVDHGDREALVAMHDGRIIAVGRYDRCPGADDAEVAFVVTDAWQHHGLGSLLLRRLADLAARRGVRTLTAETLPMNRRMLDVFRHAGFPVTTSFADGVVHVTLSLVP